MILDDPPNQIAGRGALSSGKHLELLENGHEVFARLRERRAEVLRTDLDGLVTVRSDGRRLSVETYRDFQNRN